MYGVVAGVLITHQYAKNTTNVVAHLVSVAMATVGKRRARHSSHAIRYAVTANRTIESQQLRQSITSSRIEVILCCSGMKPTGKACAVLATTVPSSRKKRILISPGRGHQISTPFPP